MSTLNCDRFRVLGTHFGHAAKVASAWDGKLSGMGGIWGWAGGTEGGGVAGGCWEMGASCLGPGGGGVGFWRQHGRHMERLW